MKSLKFIIALFLVLLGSCDLNNVVDDRDAPVNIDRLIEDNIAKISISTGISGTLLKKEGNCMPGIGLNTSCKAYPVTRTINFYEFTNQSRVEGWGPLFTSVNSKLIAQYKTDQDGFFQVTVDPGKYSVFISENDKFYANSFDGQGGICPVIVKSDSVSIIRLTLDYAVY